jgi:hypothetical protein
LLRGSSNFRSTGISFALELWHCKPEGATMTDRDFCTALKLHGDRICNMILHLEVDWVDIEIEIQGMRDFCRLHAPEKLELFEMVYVSRFQRLWEAWGYHWVIEGLPEQDALYWLDV